MQTTSFLHKVENSAESLNRQLSMTFEEKVKTLEAIAKDGDWSAVWGIPDNDALIDTMIAFHKTIPGMVAVFFKVEDQELSKFHAMDSLLWVFEPGFVMFYRTEV